MSGPCVVMDTEWAFLVQYPPDRRDAEAAAVLLAVGAPGPRVPGGAVFLPPQLEGCQMSDGYVGFRRKLETTPELPPAYAPARILPRG